MKMNPGRNFILCLNLHERARSHKGLPPVTALHPLGYCWRIGKPIHLSAFFDKPNEGSLPCLSAWLLGEPGVYSAEAERTGREGVLEMDFGLSPVVGLS